MDTSFLKSCDCKIQRTQGYKHDDGAENRTCDAHPLQVDHPAGRDEHVTNTSKQFPNIKEAKKACIITTN